MFSFIRKAYLHFLAIPLFFILFGAALNQLVFVANQGKFPVQLASEISDALKVKPGKVLDLRGHSVMAPEDHLKFLADIINLGGHYSIGDEFISLGEWAWTFTPYVWGFALIRKIKE